jgi:predicted RNA binding protein YcfA (HicA-like mRNA interferase family)
VGHADLPLASGRDHVKAFQRLGWTLQPGRGKGSHFVLTKSGVPFTVCIPGHPEVSRALLAKQLNGAGITADAYIAACRKRR